MTPLDDLTIPLCIDMDGTLIREDVTHLAIKQLISQDLLAIPKCLLWFLRGRAYLKSRIEMSVQIDLHKLTYNHELIAYIQAHKAKGRKIVLATAADQVIAQRMAEHTGLFDEVIASDGNVNKRAQFKAYALNQAFGVMGYVYAGNSRDDLKVWPSSAAIIAVNCPEEVLSAAQGMGKPILVFSRF